MSESFNTPPEIDSGQNKGANSTTEPDLVSFDANSVKEVLIKKRVNGRPKKLVWLFAILILLGGAGLAWYQWTGNSKDAGFLTMTVAKGSITDSIETTGTLEPIKQSDMGFKSDNTITALNVQPGDHVKQGEILAQQDTTNLESALRQAKSSVEQDEISVKTVTLTYENNCKTFNQQQKLFEAGAVSQTDLDTAKDAMTKSEWEVSTAQAKLANDQAQVEQAESDLSEATLVAPFNGIIGAVNGQVGQINGINSSASTLLTIMSEELQLSALVNEADIGRIKVGQNVEFTTSTYSDKMFKGKVLRITPQAETVSNVQYYPVLISCIDPNHVLLSGMSVTANIIVSRESDILTVPMMAVSYAQSYIKSKPSAANAGSAKPSTAVKPSEAKTASSSDSTTAVVLVMKNNQPSVKTVVLGLNDGSSYEVVDGLNAGDKVIVGSNQVDTTSSSGSSNSGSSNKSNQNQNSRSGGVGGGGGMGGPPPGGF